MGLDLYGHLGQAAPPDPSNGEKTRETVRTGFTNLEKIAFVGVMISAAGFFWQIYRSGKT